MNPTMGSEPSTNEFYELKGLRSFKRCEVCRNSVFILGHAVRIAKEGSETLLHMEDLTESTKHT